MYNVYVRFNIEITIPLSVRFFPNWADFKGLVRQTPNYKCLFISSYLVICITNFSKKIYWIFLGGCLNTHITLCAVYNAMQPGAAFVQPCWISHLQPQTKCYPLQTLWNQVQHLCNSVLHCATSGQPLCKYYPVDIAFIRRCEIIHNARSKKWKFKVVQSFSNHIGLSGCCAGLKGNVRNAHMASPSLVRSWAFAWLGHIFKHENE